MGDEADIVLSSARPLVAPTGRIQSSPSKESTNPTSSTNHFNPYHLEEINSQAVVSTKAPQIHVSVPAQLLAPVTDTALNDSNPMPPPTGFDQIIQSITENATVLAHFVALAVAAMFIAHIFPDIPTKWLLGLISVASLILFRYLNL